METLTQKSIQTLYLLTFVGYLFLSVFGLFSVRNHMDNVVMQHCPYMIGQNSMCPMNGLGHINAWEDIVRAIFPSLFILCVLGVGYYLWQTITIDTSSCIVRKRHKREHDLYVRLFSRGILNPKIPDLVLISAISN